MLKLFSLTLDSLDGRGIFREGLSAIRKKLEERSYASIPVFSAELASVFTSEIGVQPAGDTAELQMQISGRAPELSLEQREKRTLAKRIIKAIQPALEDGVKKESELNRKPFEKELKELDHIFEIGGESRRSSVAGAPEAGQLEGPNGAAQETEGGDETTKPELQEESHATALPENSETGDHVMTDADTTQHAEPAAESQAQEDVSMANAAMQEATQESGKAAAEALAMANKPTGEAESTVNGNVKMNAGASPQPSAQAPVPHKGPPTPPLSFQGDQQLPLAQGGIQWYMQPFDPVGTTIHEERWMGRDVMRGMSEELSELDEDELQDLVGDELEGKGASAAKGGSGTAVAEDTGAEAEPPVKVHQTRRRAQRLR